MAKQGYPTSGSRYGVHPGANGYPAVGSRYGSHPTGGSAPETLEQQIARLAADGLVKLAYLPSNSQSLPLKNLGSLGAAGDLLDDTGGCAITPALLNGKSCYSPLAASGGYLRTAVLNFTNSVAATAGVNPPCHLLVVGRYGGTPSVNLVMAGGSARIVYQDADQTSFTAGGTLQSAAGTSPTSFQLHDVFHHVQGSRYGVNGSFVSGTSVNPSTARLLTEAQRFAIGARNTDGGLRSTSDVALVIVADNRIPYAEYSSLIDKINDYFALSSGKESVYVQPEDATVSAPGFTAGVAIPFLGQSNASNYATVAATGTWNANTYIFSNQCTWIAGADPWDDETNQQDPISIDGVSSNFGWAAPLAALAQARYGVNVCMIPCARSSVTMAHWQKGANGLKRGYLYGSAIWRMKKALEAGMTIPYVVVHQGEAEAIGSQAQRDAWPALAQQLIADVRADLGLPTLEFRFALVNNNTSAAGYLDMQAKIASIATATVKTFAIGAVWEADGVHLSGAGLDTTAVNCDAA